MRIVMIGNGIAAISAAATIRKFDTESSLTMVSDENTPFYSRPRLIEYLAGKSSFEKIVIHGPEWFARQGIEVLMGTGVDAIHPERSEITGSFGTMRYDALLIASGASPSLPAFCTPGLEQVYTLRTKADADAIISAAAHAGTAMVVGGGLLGIETAYALAERGLTPTIVEYFDRLLPKQLDAEAAAMLQSMLEAKGMQILLGRSTSSLARNGANVIAHFKDGSNLEADIAIVSTGVRPNVGFLGNSGIAVNRGIVVDERMRTNVPGVFAAGDCAEFGSTLYGIWPAAKEQGEIAGAIIAGQNAVYKGSIMSARLKVAGIDVASMGNIALTANMRVESHRDEAGFAKLFFEGDRLRGAILIGAAVRDQIKLQGEMELPALG